MGLDFENFPGGEGSDEVSHGQIFFWIRACNDTIRAADVDELVDFFRVLDSLFSQWQTSKCNEIHWDRNIARTK